MSTALRQSDPNRPARGSRFHQRILAEADSVAQMYLEGRKRGQPITRELKEAIESILATDYDGRALYELLQNGHDGHARGACDGKVRILLREDEGEWGALYVANAGNPFADEDFTAICRVALSSKNPAEGIGNKGVGFKSSVQLSTCPEIYSGSGPGDTTLSGYCFRFARPADFADAARRIAPDDQGLAAELEANVASLMVPVPLGEIPDVVAEIAADGFVTVVRLPLRSVEAARRCSEQLDALLAQSIPFHLFLERVERIELQRSGGAAPVDVARTRQVTRRSATAGSVVDNVVLDNDVEYLMLRRTVPEAAMLAAIEASRRENRVGSNWDNWKGDAEVQVALPQGDPLAAGRLFAFLPMAPSAPVPMAGFVNGPFFVHLSRRDLEEDVPVNALLLDAVADLCAEAVVASTGGRLELPDTAPVDLIGWHPPHLPRLVAAFDRIGVDLARLRCVPTGDGLAGKTTIAEGWLWPGDNRRELGLEPVSRAAGVRFLDPALGAARSDRLTAVATVLGHGLQPDDETVARWAESVATTLTDAPVDLGRWATFYDELAELLPHSREAVVGTRIVLDDRAILVPAGGDDQTDLFFAPQGSDDVLVTEAPGEVRARIAFTHPDVPWYAQRAKRPGRAWLERLGLVRDYKSDTVLRIVSSLMKAEENDAGRWRLLAFAFTLWSTARELPEQAIRDAKLLVPARSGWLSADRASFGAGWSSAGDDTGDLDTLLEDFCARAAGASPSVARLADTLLARPDAIGQPMVGDTRFVAFLEVLGVGHGLRPWWSPAVQYRLIGDQVMHPERAGRLPGIRVSAEDQRRWREVAASWPRRTNLYETVEYRAASDVAVLPGQFDYDTFDETARRLYAELIIRGLNHWNDSALEFRFVRPESDTIGTGWPTLAATFLATAPWIPQTVPGERTRVIFGAPSAAWWLRTADTPSYLPAQPPSLRPLATAKVCHRLDKVGVRFWDEPTSAPERLTTLTDLVQKHGGAHREQVALALRKAYEAAWHDIVAQNAAIGGLEASLPVVASRSGSLEVVTTVGTAEVVYVPVADGMPQERLLAQAPVALLPFRDRELARKVGDLLRGQGAASLRFTSDAAVQVLTNGREAGLKGTQPLLGENRAWLGDLIAAVVEARSNRIPPVSSAQMQTIHGTLSSARLAIADDLLTSIDAHRMSPPSIYTEVDGVPLVVVRSDPGTSGFHLLESASTALMDLAGFHRLGDVLRLALIDLRARVGETGEPQSSDIAAVLGLSEADVAGLQAERRSFAPDIASVLPLLAALDVGLAEALRDEGSQLRSRDELLAWLERRLPKGLADAATVLSLSEGGALIDALCRLGVTLVHANHAFRGLGLQTFHNPGGHQRQFKVYLQTHRSAIVDRIRSSFLDAFNRRESLASYVQLRDLEGLDPDPIWLDEHWDLDGDLIATRVDTWLLGHGLPNRDLGLALDPLHDLRAANRKVLASTLGHANPLVMAWLHRHSAGVGPSLPEFQAAAEKMTAAGLFDFERLTSADVVAWLASAGHWPGGMPHSVKDTELGLSEAEVERAREQLRSDRARRPPTFIDIDGRTYATDIIEFGEIADAIRGGLTDDQLATPFDPTPLVELDPAAEGHRRPGKRGTCGGSARRPPEATIEAIGFAGEIAVGEWLRARFDVAPEDCWVSGYRNKYLGDGKGDDGLGCDYRLVTEGKTLYIEVKATTGDDPQFQLEESEVRLAQSLELGEEFVVVFVTHVLDSSRRHFNPLPNPFAPGGLQHYRVAGKALRLRFKLPDATAASHTEHRDAPGKPQEAA